jgi:hypothetical protein
MSFSQRKFLATALEIHARAQTEHVQLRASEFVLKTDPQFGERLYFDPGSDFKNWHGTLNEGPPVSVHAVGSLPHPQVLFVALAAMPGRLLAAT